MNEARKQAFIRIGLIVVAVLLSIFLAFYINNVFLKIPFIIIAIAGTVFLVRLYITYKRKKLYFDGKVLVIKPPKRAIGRHTVIMQKGKVSKKLYTYQKPNMRVGGNYVVVYEEKSFNILEVQEMKVQMAGMKAIKKNPKFKM